MWDYISINILLSLAIIVFAHYIWDHLKNTYSTKKQKNLVDFQTNKYKAIIEELRENRVVVAKPSIEEEDVFLSPEEKEWMVKELSAYLAQ